MKFSDDFYKKMGLKNNTLGSVFNNSLINNNMTKSLMQLSKLNQNLQKINSCKFISPVKIPIPKIPNPRLQDAMIEEREKIKDLIAEVATHQERANCLYNRLLQNPHSSFLLSVSIIISIFLIITCISIPLLIIPTDTYITIDSIPNILLENLFSIKGLFILISTLLICSIFIVFLIKNNSMKFSKEDLEKLKNITMSENYSIFLKNYVENTKET